LGLFSIFGGNFLTHFPTLIFDSNHLSVILRGVVIFRPSFNNRKSDLFVLFYFYFFDTNFTVGHLFYPVKILLLSSIVTSDNNTTLHITYSSTLLLFHYPTTLSQHTRYIFLVIKKEGGIYTYLGRTH
jgi:hypothetical protein